MKAATTDPVHDNELWGFQIWLDRSNVKAYPKDIWVQISAAENKLLCFFQYIIRILFLKASTEILFIVLYLFAQVSAPKAIFKKNFFIVWKLVWKDDGSSPLQVLLGGNT